jgi:hypothetical protein|tara:strand:- start:1692 stop:2075 length:384 start_codon:yes stop_codon:yes gene_type:complete
MLSKHDDALRAAAGAFANVGRDVRQKLVRVTGREERYSEKFVTILEERFDGKVDNGLYWTVSTHISDKQSGEETATGSDLFVSIEIAFEGVKIVSKGIQAQAKINKNKRSGLSVDSKVRLKAQCETM